MGALMVLVKGTFKELCSGSLGYAFLELRGPREI